MGVGVCSGSKRMDQGKGVTAAQKIPALEQRKKGGAVRIECTRRGKKARVVKIKERKK